MYNLLVTAKINAWEQSYYEYDRSRFLEFTVEAIASTFKELTPAKIEMLKEYPCLFAYEGEYDDVRVGNLTSIKERGKKIFIEFTFKAGIPSIPFESIKSIATLLDIRDWEMSRTHWAVKDEDLMGRLETAGIVPLGIINASEKGVVQPIQKTTHPKITTVQGFIGKVLTAEGDPEAEVFYRGHSNRNKYRLEPSLFRKDDDGKYLYLDNEHILYRELMVSNSPDFESDAYTLDRLIRMQHYSLPTRLLDITSNPLIALYFACKSSQNEDGEVITLSMKRDKVKYFDSDVGSCIANLARLPRRDKENIDLEHPDFNEQVAVKRLLHFIKGEKPYFEPRILPEDLKKVVCVKGKQSNVRISSQSGAFLLFGLGAVLSEDGSSDIRVARITVTNKTSILRELDLLNINESTVFPYIESSARYIAEKYKYRRSLVPGEP